MQIGYMAAVLKGHLGGTQFLPYFKSLVTLVLRSLYLDHGG